MFPRPSWKKVSVSLLGSAIQAFGLANIHAHAAVTEGGVLGATLLLDHWLALSPAVSSLLLNLLCYLFGWKMLGREFLLYSMISSGSYSLFYALLEPFAPAVPFLISSPLIAALSGAVFVGVGAGLCIRMGGATCGDDALAMALSHLTGWGIQWIYLLTDLTVLVLSVSYIPLERLGWSLLTVILSGQIISLVQKLPARRG